MLTVAVVINAISTASESWKLKLIYLTPVLSNGSRKL